MGIKKTIKDSVYSSLNIKNDGSFLANKLELVDVKETSKKSFFSSKTFKISFASLSLACLSAGGIILAVNLNKPVEVTPNVLINIELTETSDSNKKSLFNEETYGDNGPAVSLVVGNDESILQSSGDNNTGKALIYNNSLNKKSLKNGLNNLVDDSKNIGFIAPISSNNKENSINVTITCDEQNLSNYQKIIEEKIATFNEENNINCSCNIVSALSDETLNEYVLICDPTLTNEDLEKIEFVDKIQIISSYMNEVKDFTSSELEDFYNEYKKYIAKFGEFDYLESLVDESKINLGISYRLFIQQLYQAKSNLLDYYNAIYSSFIDKTSDYFRELKKYFNDVKDYVDSKHNYDNDENTYKTHLDEAWNNFHDDSNNLNNFKESIIKDVINGKELMINNALDALKSSKDVLLSNIQFKNYYDANQKYSEYLTNKMSQAISNFKETYRDDIDAYRDETKNFLGDKSSLN